MLDGHLAALTIESLAVEGALVVRLCRGAKVTVRRLRVAKNLLPDWVWRTFDLQILGAAKL